MIEHPECASPDLLETLSRLMSIPELKLFFLAGGTSLALRYGHRRSEDLDLFCNTPFDSELCATALRATFNHVVILNRTAGSISATVNGVKLDLLHDSYPLLSEPETEDGFRLLCVPDVAAMKVTDPALK